jgi:serine/threonine protein kinase
MQPCGHFQVLAYALTTAYRTRHGCLQVGFCPHVTLAPGTRLGPYEIVAPLGAGGMGEVYRAKDTRLDREVAVKVLPEALSSDSGTSARFEREAKAVATLSHPNILAIHDVGSHEGVRYAVTELLEGRTLREHLEEGPLGPRKAIEYAAQIVAGLAAAHEKGIVHRDLKPENVFVTRDGHVKILDFGLASKRSLDATGRPDTCRPSRSGDVPSINARTSSPSERSSTKCSRAGALSAPIQRWRR